MGKGGTEIKSTCDVLLSVVSSYVDTNVDDGRRLTRFYSVWLVAM